MVGSVQLDDAESDEKRDGLGQAVLILGLSLAQAHEVGFEAVVAEEASIGEAAEIRFHGGSEGEGEGDASVDAGLGEAVDSRLVCREASNILIE